MIELRQFKEGDLDSHLVRVKAIKKAKKGRWTFTYPLPSLNWKEITFIGTILKGGRLALEGYSWNGEGYDPYYPYLEEADPFLIYMIYMNVVIYKGKAYV